MKADLKGSFSILGYRTAPSSILVLLGLFISFSCFGQKVERTSTLSLLQTDVIFQKSKVYLHRDVSWENVPIIDLSAEPFIEYMIEDSAIMRSTYAGAILGSPIKLENVMEDCKIWIKPKHQYMMIVRDKTLPPIKIPLQPIVEMDSSYVEHSAFTIPKGKMPKWKKKDILELLAAAQKKAHDGHAIKSMPVDELYELSRSKVGKGTSWNIERFASYVDMVFVSNYEGEEFRETVVLELGWIEAL